MSTLAIFLLVAFASTSTYRFIAAVETPTKGDHGDAVTLDTVSTTGTKDLLREATGWERPTYGTPSFYPPAGSNKGYSQPIYATYQGQTYQRGYPGYSGGYYNGYQTGGYQSGYMPEHRGGYYGNYGNNKGWSSAGSGWTNNYGRPTSGGYGQGNYKGSAVGNQGWRYGSDWYGGNQIRPSSGYNWPSSGGYRGDKGYGSSYVGNNWGVNQGYGGYGGGYATNQGYGGGYGNRGYRNKGIGNQIYGSGYGGTYTGYKGWNNSGYGNTIPSQGNYLGTGNWGSYGGHDGNYKGGSSPRINNINTNRWSDRRGGFVNYPNNKGQW